MAGQDNGVSGVVGVITHVNVAGSARHEPSSVTDYSPSCTPIKGRFTRANQDQTPSKRSRNMISDTPTPSTPSDDLADCRLATVLLRLEALERKYDSIESQLVGQVAENIMLRARCEILESLKMKIS